jgi:hypothetical protein
VERAGYPVGHPRKPECFSQRKISQQRRPAAILWHMQLKLIQTTGLNHQFNFASLK